jgi:hypothetical protein
MAAVTNGAAAAPRTAVAVSSRMAVRRMDVPSSIALTLGRALALAKLDFVCQRVHCSLTLPAVLGADAAAQRCAIV